MDPEATRSKILNLNKLQTWILVIGGIIGIGGAVTAWAHGWLGLPDKVDRIEQAQTPLLGLTNRVQSIEDQQKLMWAKRNEDHDLLTKIDQSLQDLKEQQTQLRDDVKGLKK